MAGALTGMGLNTMWEKLKLPGTDKPVAIRGEGQKDYDWSFVYQTGFIWALMISGAIAHVSNIMPLSFGMLLGSLWSKSSNRREYIGGT